MIDLTFATSSFPLYAFIFSGSRKGALLSFDGKDVWVEGNVIAHRLWSVQPLAAFLNAYAPLPNWSPSPEEARARFIYAWEGRYWRYDRLTSRLTSKRRAAARFAAGEFFDPNALRSVSDRWYVTFAQSTLIAGI